MSETSRRRESGMDSTGSEEADVDETIKSSTVEVPRDEYESLLRRVEELEKVVDEMVQPMRLEQWFEKPSIAVQTLENRKMVQSLQERINRSESCTELYEPSTKKERIKKAVLENFEDWSIITPKGDILSTNTSEGRRDSRRLSLLQHLRREINESFQNVEVYRVMEELGERDRFDYRENDRGKVLVSVEEE